MKIPIKQIYIALSFLILPFVFANSSFANKVNFKPFYASIKSEKVNVRIGPNVRYPIKWVFVKKNEPVEVVASFEQWRKIRDINGDEGWVNSNMLSNRRYIIIVGTKKVPIFKKKDLSSKIIAEAEQDIRGNLISCDPSLCMVEMQKIKGWVEKKYIWGIYNDENIK